MPLRELPSRVERGMTIGRRMPADLDWEAKHALARARRGSKLLLHALEREHGGEAALHPSDNTRKAHAL
jgi:hypothetical protein